MESLFDFAQRFYVEYSHGSIVHEGYFEISNTNAWAANERYYRYIVARYGAYIDFWELINEGTYTDAWIIIHEIGAHVDQRNNPENPGGVHGGATTEWDELENNTHFGILSEEEPFSGCLPKIRHNDAGSCVSSFVLFSRLVSVLIRRLTSISAVSNASSSFQLNFSIQLNTVRSETLRRAAISDGLKARI